ncbi:MAG: DJ-1/PfpI/YhbO family deglycase/protease [Candidatus Eremiobacteraeota bacterium]|nr:DJ-1/PfpI/YhbO family deglycase/protease [Candidatus Eremiobacteraeota bacterium]
MQGATEGKRVAALVGDGFEEAELEQPRRALEAAGAVVTVVGVSERSRQRIRAKRGLDDSPLTARADELVADCTAEDFDALLIPGGQSPDQIRTDREVQRFVRELDGAKKPLFAIGHGAQVLISSQVTRGRTMTGSPSISDDIRNAGGLYRDQPLVQDAHWVTSRGIADLNQFSRAIVEKLATAAVATA